MSSDSVIILSNVIHEKSLKQKLIKMAAINFLLVLTIGLVWLFSQKIYGYTLREPLPPRINAYELPIEHQLKKNSNKEHRLTIFYEALCPDSERFMQQLTPVYEALKDYLLLEFVPFGLTKLYCKDIINGKCPHPQLSCKHGPIGCRANRLHDCVLQYSENQEKQMNFITCTMGTYKSTIEKCITLLHFSAYDIDTCMTFQEGTELQLKSYNRTSVYKPKKLPVLVFDGSYSEEFQNAAFEDFRVLICNLLAHKYEHFNFNSSPMICQTNDVFN